MRLATLIFAGLAVVGSPGQAQGSLVAGAVQTGSVGERYDGYMGFVTPPTEGLRRQVSAINIRRRNLYIDLASRRNVTAEVVGIATACELLGQLQVGEAYLLKDGVWRRRGSGRAVALPSYCR